MGAGPRLMPTSAHLPFETLYGALKAAAEATRLRILALLGEAEPTVSDLTAILRQSQPRISRHLRLLAEAELHGRFLPRSHSFFPVGCPEAARTHPPPHHARLGPRVCTLSPAHGRP